MRAFFLLASASAAFAALAACATSDEVLAEEVPSPEEAGVLPAVPTDGGDAGPDATEVAVPKCNEGGWCVTPLPADFLQMKDIWPLASGRAFAVAESAAVGLKVLEWRPEDTAWRYVDDNSQNQIDGAFSSTIWSPNDDTVYFTAGAFVYRGTRLAPPATEWSWSRTKLDDNAYPGDPAHADHAHGRPPGGSLAVGVWGIDADNVYAWYSNSIFRWKSVAGGAPSWVAEYVADDTVLPTQHLYFVSATGSGPNDISFAGVRSDSSGTFEVASCPILVRKSNGAFARVADAVAVSALLCTAREGVPLIGGPVGKLTNIQSAGPGAIVGLKGQYVGQAELVHISRDGATVSNALPTFWTVDQPPLPSFRSFWRSADHEWLTQWGVVIRGDRMPTDGGYTRSSLPQVLAGAPYRGELHRVRGTSDTNIWAIGDGYAFHKTTP